MNHGCKEWAYFDYLDWRNAPYEQRRKLLAVASTHIHVSQQWMHSYLGEFAFRSNHRHMRNAMFDLLIAAL